LRIKDHIFQCPSSELAKQQWTKAVEEQPGQVVTVDQDPPTHPQNCGKTFLSKAYNMHCSYNQTPSCRPHMEEGTTAGQLQDSIGWGFLALPGEWGV